jgi:hypothetical protein
MSAPTTTTTDDASEAGTVVSDSYTVAVHDNWRMGCRPSERRVFLYQEQHDAPTTVISLTFDSIPEVVRTLRRVLREEIRP